MRLVPFISVAELGVLGAASLVYHRLVLPNGFNRVCHGVCVCSDTEALNGMNFPLDIIHHGTWPRHKSPVSAQLGIPEVASSGISRYCFFRRDMKIPS